MPSASREHVRTKARLIRQNLTEILVTPYRPSSAESLAVRSSGLAFLLHGFALHNELRRGADTWHEQFTRVTRALLDAADRLADADFTDAGTVYGMADEVLLQLKGVEGMLTLAARSRTARLTGSPRLRLQ
jgi:hypothetical protein